MMTAEQLKNSILQLAMQGRLVEQRPEEGSGIENLALIEKSIRIQKKYNINEDELPFEIPSSWAWTKVGNITVLYNGRAFKPSDWTEGGLPIVRIQNLNDQNAPYNRYNGSFEDVYHLYGGELLFAWSGTPGTSFGAHIWREEEAVLNQHIYKIEFPEEYLDKHYFALALNFQVLSLIRLAHGSAGLQHVTKGIFQNTLIPIPPLEEQKRIVAKIEELMPLVEQYAAASTKLNNLNTSFPDMMKKSILQEAVQGKLVSQDPSDEPASELLKRITEEKQKLIKEGKIKKPKPLPEITEEEIPFDIPENWEWVRLGSILNMLTDGTHKTPHYVTDGVPFISVKDMSSGKISFANTKFISYEEANELNKRCNPEKGDILLSKVGTTGVPAPVDTDIKFSLFVSVALLKFNSNLVNREYLINVISSPCVQKQCAENTRGVGNKNWVMRDIANTLIPIAPLNEQIRIVAELEKIIPYCGIMGLKVCI